MANYSLLALDLDGTLLTDDKRITSESKYWIRKAMDAGITVMIASGRGLTQIESFRKELELNTPMVLANGTEVWTKPGELLERHLIHKEDIRVLHGLAKEVNADFWGYSVDHITKELNVWTDEMYDYEWMTFSMRHDDPVILNQLKEKIKELHRIELTSSASVNMEFSLRGISKASGVKKVSEYLDIQMENVMAIGDNLNDYHLIEAAGLGIAMENGNDQLKQIANGITASNEEDGVAKAIQRYLFGIEV